jgi:aspartate racemase
LKECHRAIAWLGTMKRMTSDSEHATLGLVAGLGVGAGIFYYRSLVNAHLARALSPRMVMVHANVQKVMSLANAREGRQLADYLVGLLEQLAGGGAQIATIPAFAPQVCAQELAERTPLPLISLLDAIVDEVTRRKLARVAIFGARVTMETGLFGRLQQATEVIPLRSEEVDCVSGIYGEIVRNEKATPTELETVRALAHSLIQRESLDAILLAGTDFSFVFNPENTNFPHLDGARIHIDAIMARLTC